MKVTKTIRDIHYELKSSAKFISRDAKDIITDFAQKNHWEFTERIKELDSFAQKIESGVYQSVEEIDDFYACEIVTPGRNEILKAKEFIYKNFDVIAEKPNKATSPDNFSFNGLRIYARLRGSVAGRPHYAWMKFEIQVKTLLEKAWGIATHDFTYKCKKIEWSKERLAYQLKAILDHADIIISQTTDISKYVISDFEFESHSHINSITEWILSEWGENSCPSNMKRLSETVNNICKYYKIQIDDLKSIVKQFRTTTGTTEDLSIYSTILKSLILSSYEPFLKEAGVKRQSKKKPRLVILREWLFRVFRG